VSDADTSTRAVDDVVARCHALAAVIGLEEGADPDDVRADVDEHGLAPWLAVNEQVFYEHRMGIELADDEDLAQATIDVTWRSEALWALLWALRFVDELDPAVECGGSEAYAQMAPDLDPAETVPDIALRPVAEIAAMRDQYMALDPQERDDLDPGIVFERRHALMWVLSDAAWDDIEPDA
jgi:hypothetical protein